jgi:DNA-binding FadR family transcriptional regulator
MIVDAIRRGDPEAARAAVRTLLIQAEADAMTDLRKSEDLSE